MEMPVSPNEEINNLDCCDESTKSFFLKNHDKWTIKQMNNIISYLESKVRSLRDSVEDNCTIEEFEKIKNNDIDNDSEEGE